MAKKFFYVCAGVLMLVSSFALGSAVTQAQQGGTTVRLGAVDWVSGLSVAGVVNRVLVRTSLTSTGPGAVLGAKAVTSPVPGTSPIVGIGAFEEVAILENGDVYNWVGHDNGGWELAGNLTDGVVGVATSPAVNKVGLRVTPNPTPRGFAVSYTLASPSAVQVEVVDAQGRIVHRTLKQLESAGRHEIVVDHDRSGNALRPGQYFVSLRGPGVDAASKATVLN